MRTVSDEAIASLQRSQYKHDKANHFDILSLHKVDRLKHYGLHFAKYAGRIALGEAESGKSLEETAVDSLLVSLSAANTLSSLLTCPVAHLKVGGIDLLTSYTSYSGRFADAVEKLDHAEFDGMRLAMNESNQHIFELALCVLADRGLDVDAAVARRREFLAKRAFFSAE